MALRLLQFKKSTSRTGNLQGRKPIRKALLPSSNCLISQNKQAQNPLSKFRNEKYRFVPIGNTRIIKRLLWIHFKIEASFFLKEALVEGEQI